LRARGQPISGMQPARPHTYSFGSYPEQAGYGGTRQIITILLPERKCPKTGEFGMYSIQVGVQSWDFEDFEGHFRTTAEDPKCSSIPRSTAFQVRFYQRGLEYSINFSGDNRCDNEKLFCTLLSNSEYFRWVPMKVFPHTETRRSIYSFKEKEYTRKESVPLEHSSSFFRQASTPKTFTFSSSSKVSTVSQKNTLLRYATFRRALFRFCLAKFRIETERYPTADCKRYESRTIEILLQCV
jgi:hypothetical protein